jgi:hypothetical protein
MPDLSLQRLSTSKGFSTSETVEALNTQKVCTVMQMPEARSSEVNLSHPNQKDTWRQISHFRDLALRKVCDVVHLENARSRKFRSKSQPSKSKGHVAPDLSLQKDLYTSWGFVSVLTFFLFPFLSIYPFPAIFGPFLSLSGFQTGLAFC